MKRGKLIILSGPSGVGKGTIRKLLFENAELNLYYSISMTTRSARENEVEGVDYFFVGIDTFKKHMEEGNLLEWAIFVDNYYGTPKDYVNKLLNEGKNVILEIEVQGAIQVMKQWDDVLTVFIIPPNLDELESRIRNRRTESDDIVNARLEKAKKELATKDEYRYVVLNDNVENAAKTIAEIIKKEINKENA